MSMFCDDSLYPSLPKNCSLNVLQQDSDSAVSRKRKRKAEKYLEEQYSRKLQFETGIPTQTKNKDDLSSISKKGDKRQKKSAIQEEKQKQSLELQDEISNGLDAMNQQLESQVHAGKSKKQKLIDKIKSRKKINKEVLNKQMQLQSQDEISIKGTKKVAENEQEANLVGDTLSQKEGKSKKAKIKKQIHLEQQQNEVKITKKQQEQDPDEKPKKSLNNEPKSNYFAKLEKQLMGGRFRWLNEQLYTIDSKSAFEMMQENEEYFEQYHEGFRSQIAQWPVQPINEAIEFVKRKSCNFVVADFGCGEAQLADSVPNSKVHSIDLVSDNPKVIVCDMANTPLQNESCEIAIFCLALMGTNYGDFLKEANRVLKCRGWLWIAEVRSRFDKDKKLKPFVDAIESLGFQLMQKDLQSTHFVVLVFKKKAKLQGKQKNVQWPELKACQYKRR